MAAVAGDWDRFTTRCDACTQQATSQATRAGGHRIQLCGHHAAKHHNSLMRYGWIILALTATPAETSV